MQASLLSCCTVRLAWAILLELCIFDDMAHLGELCLNLESREEILKLITLITDMDVMLLVLVFAQMKQTNLSNESVDNEIFVFI